MNKNRVGMYAMYTTIKIIVILTISCEYESGVQDAKENSEEGAKISSIDMEEMEQSRILIKTTTSQIEGGIELVYVKEKSGEKKRPRIAEMFLEYSSNLEYKNADPGNSVLEAKKQLVVQEIEDGKLRVVVLAPDNTNELDTGTLCTLKFNKKGDGKARVAILTEQPIFAPDEANEGLLVGDPVEF